MLAILDGTIVPTADATIPVTDAGLLRGDGVFEVIRVYDGRAFALDDHLARMVRSAANLRLELDLAAARREIEALVREHPDDGLIRYLVTRGGRRIGLTEPLHDNPPTLALASITYAPTRILDDIKSLSYGSNMLADRLAKERGADLALLVTPHGRVLEGATSSFFCSFDGETLVTPPLSDHVLDSITRRRLMPLTGAREEAFALDDLHNVREAFLASTTREVHAVRRIDAIELPAAPGPLTDRAAEAFSAHVRESP